MALFENYERRIDKINGVLAQYGISSVEECRELCQSKGFDPYEIVKGIQPICFENACWAYTVGAAIALKAGVKSAAEAAKMIGVGLQSFCIDGSVAEDRKVGLGHGNLGAMLLSDESKCFAFLAGHESRMALNAQDEIIGYEFVNLGKMMDFIKKGDDANTALEKAKGHYGQWDSAAKYIDPRQE